MTRITRTSVIAMGVVFGVFVGSSANAQGYLGVGVGSGHASIPSVSTTIGGVAITGSGDNTSDTAYKLYGGYQITPNWGVEVGYNDLGKYSAKLSALGLTATESARADNIYVAATGTLHFNDRFSVLGKFGVARNNIRSSQACFGGTCVQGDSSHRTRALWGLGAQYSFTKNIGMRLEYENYGRVTGDDVWGTGDSGAIKASAAFLSVKYSF